MVFEIHSSKYPLLIMNPGAPGMTVASFRVFLVEDCAYLETTASASPLAMYLRHSGALGHDGYLIYKLSGKRIMHYLRQTHQLLCWRCMSEMQELLAMTVVSSRILLT